MRIQFKPFMNIAKASWQCTKYIIFGVCVCVCVCVYACVSLPQHAHVTAHVT